MKIEITDKLKSDFQATLDFWDAARKPKNKIKYKEDWKEHQRIKYLFCRCAFCQYILCRDCPLKFCNEISFFNQWSYAKTQKAKCKHAKIIYQVIKPWIDENITNNKTGFIEV